MSPSAVPEQAVARLRLIETADQRVVVAIPNTNYQLHLQPEGTIDVAPGKRLRGVVRADVWKLDRVTSGGDYIEPVYGKPRRIQGHVLGAMPEGNGLIVEVHDCPFVGLLPERWDAAAIPLGARVGLDVRNVPTLEPIR